MVIKQTVSSLIETRPARLQFRHGTVAGTIYAYRIGGQIVEAYRGYGYGYTPNASALRSEPMRGTNQ